MAVRKKAPAAAPVDTVALKQRLARDERDEAANRTLQRQNEGKARDQRERLGRSSVGETRARDDAQHFKRQADSHQFSARARRDSLDSARRGKIPSGKAPTKHQMTVRHMVAPRDGSPHREISQEEFNAAADRAKRAALRPVRLGADNTKAKPQGRKRPGDGVDQVSRIQGAADDAEITARRGQPYQQWTGDEIAGNTKKKSR